MSTYELVSFSLCPYVQRSAIALEEKAAPYTIKYIDLAAKPQWFIDISPLGKVPLLRVGEVVLFESAVICEFVDETSPGVSLHSSDPLQRAYDRAWIEVASVALVDLYKLMVATDETTLNEVAKALSSKLERFEKQLDTQGPYFHNDFFSLVDCAAAPLLQRTLWTQDIAPDLNLFERIPKVHNWARKLLERPSVQRSTLPDIRDTFKEYLKGRGSPLRDVEPTALGRRLLSA